MKKIIPFALTLFSFLLVHSSRANHFAGGDLTYVCLGGNQYRFNLNLFVDCAASNPPGSQQTVYYSSSCGGSSSTQLSLSNAGGTEISQLCPSQVSNSSCNGGTLPGMRIYRYTGIITLTTCNTWTLSWGTCCRNAAISNLQNPSTYGTYLEATLNSATAACNSSPAFTAQAIPYVCANQLVNYNYGVTEKDGDSLNFSLINAMAVGPTNLTYASGYSATSPITGITIDPLTGQLIFTPTTIGNFVVVVLIKEYDSNGNLIGTVMRDLQFVVQSCSNNVPDPTAGTITNLSGLAVQTGPYTLELCEGSKFSFDANYSDADTGDKLTVMSNITTVLPGATFDTTGKNPVIAHISWTAPPGSANSKIIFSVTVNDGSCPTPAQQTFIYTLKVIARTWTGPDYTICRSQSATLNASGGSTFTWTVLSGTPIILGTNFSCNPCASPAATPTNTTVYQVTSNLSGVCANNDTVTVYISNPSVSFTADPLTGFYPLTVNFINTSSVNAINLFWNFGDPASVNNTSILINPSHTYDEGGDYIVTLIGTDTNGCADTATTLIVVEKLFVPNVFTPGGYNPKFLVSANGLSEYSIQLFNRWGKKVFESNDINNSWDGKDCVDGTYYYLIKATGVDGKLYEKRGFVQRIGSH